MALRTVSKLIAGETHDFVVRYNELHSPRVRYLRPSPTARRSITSSPSYPIRKTGLCEGCPRCQIGMTRLLVLTFEQTTPNPYLSLITQRRYVPRMSIGIENSGKKYHLSSAILLHPHTIRLRVCPGPIAEPPELPHIYLKSFLKTSQGQAVEPWLIPTDAELDEMQKNADKPRPYDGSQYSLDVLAQQFSPHRVQSQCQSCISPVIYHSISLAKPLESPL